jgi:hypothetical protein
VEISVDIFLGSKFPPENYVWNSDTGPQNHGHLGKMALLTPFKLQWICPLRNMDDARLYSHRLLNGAQTLALTATLGVSL